MKIKDYILYPLVFFTVWRVSLFIIAYLAPLAFPEFRVTFPYHNERLVSTGLPNFVWTFGNFDGVHYIGIAQNGYAYQYTQAFFPLYPLLMNLLSKLAPVGTLMSGLLLSNTFFLVGLIFFFKLVKESFDKKTAIWSTALLTSFPTSYYFGAVYTEGLFFMLVILTFYLVSKKHYLLASVFGFFAAGARLVGIFLTASALSNDKFKILPVLIIPIGLISYMLYLQLEYHNAFYFLTSQTAFGQERSTTNFVLLPQVVYRWIKQIFTTEGLQLFNAMFELGSLILSLILLSIAWKRMNKEWVVFSLLAIITPTLTGSLISMPRYILVAFPMYIIFAQIKKPYIKILTILFSGMGLVLCTALFTRGYWIA